jgi:nitrite reductase/ring-hydroxylating ferredoxin subunit
MSTRVKVARVEELPPGRRRTVSLGARDLTVYNVEGRYYATAEHAAHVGVALPPGHASSLAHCSHHGASFEAAAADPAEREGEVGYRVSVEDEVVVVYVEDALAD